MPLSFADQFRLQLCYHHYCLELSVNHPVPMPCVFPTSVGSSYWVFQNPEKSGRRIRKQSNPKKRPKEYFVIPIINCALTGIPFAIILCRSVQASALLPPLLLRTISQSSGPHALCLPYVCGLKLLGTLASFIRAWDRQLKKKRKKN